MPEAPEIKLSKDFLSHELSDKVITLAETYSQGRYRSVPPIGWKEFHDKLPVKINAINCKGKFIWWKFTSIKDNSEIFMLNTYGMTGQWLTKGSTHPCISFTHEDGSKIVFDDVRHFGTVKFGEKSLIDKKLKQLGPDIFQCDSKTFIQALQKKANKTLAEVLMNQRVIAGVGNYIKAEALYKARLSPHTLVKDLNQERLQSLYQAVQEVITTAYQQGGATIRSFKNPDGSEGYATKNFQVYKKKKDPLGNDVISETTKDKRTTWWVPILQK